jgi:CcmD family protein
MSHMTQTQVLTWVMAVPLITWIGLFAYMLMIDRSLRRLERNEKDSDDL